MNESGSELLPYSTSDEGISDVIATLSTLFPSVGSIIGSLASGEVNKHRWARLTRLLVDMESKINSLNDETKKYIKTEEFHSLFEDAINKYYKEHREEKLLYFKNYIMSICENHTDTYDEKQKIFKILENIQPSHISLLLALDQDPNNNSHSYIGSVLGTLNKRLIGWNEETIVTIVDDLNSYKITNIQGLHTMITPASAENLKVLITKFGRRFINYIII